MQENINYSAHLVRVFLRVYFLVAFTLTSVIGNQCCKLAVELSLVLGHNVSLNRMTGWLSEVSFFSNLWDLRRISGGAYFGPFMLLVAIISPVTDLAVNGLVKSVHVSSRCPFGTGMVLDLNSTPFSGPPSNGKPVSVAMNAQLVSVSNNGLQGIYWKVNNATNFAAQEQDVLAAWTCVDLDDDLQYSTEDTESYIVEDLLSRDYLYEIFESIALGGGNEPFTHFAIWSSSAATGDLGVPWDVRASIDTSADGFQGPVMRNFYCNVSNNAADPILKQIDTTWTLHDWLQGFQGGCYDGSGTPANPNVQVFMEQYLNTMLMVEAGANNFLQAPASGSDSTQGCLATETNIPTSIWVLVGLVGIIDLALFTAWMGLLATLAIASKRRETGKELIACVPCSESTWILEAARQSAMRSRTKVP